MFTNQKILWFILIFFIIGAALYFTVSRFTKEIVISPSPAPTPTNLDFTFKEQNSPENKAAAELQRIAPQQQVQPQPTELPFAKNKKLSQFPGILTAESLQNKKAVIQTQKGIIQLAIYPEATMAASNFMILAANGFYDNLTFHRVEDWVVQGGDPEGTGSGGAGYQFPDELVAHAYKKGMVAYANSGPNTNSSQFFILKKDYPLEPKYTVFGTVIAGMDVVEKIRVGDIMQKVVIQLLR